MERKRRHRPDRADGRERPTPPQREPPALVLFDLDETLFDDAYARRHGLGAIRRLDPPLRRRSVPWLFARYGELLRVSHREQVERGTDPLSSRKERFRRLGLSCGADWDEERVDHLVGHYLRAYAGAMRAIPGSPALLDRIRSRAKVGVVTNHRQDEQEAKLETIGLRDRVDFLVASAAVGAWKPDPGIFVAALDRARVPAEQAVMVGDSWEEDVLGARSAGIRPVWFDRYRRSEPAPSPGVDVIRSYLPAEPVLRTLGFPP